MKISKAKQSRKRIVLLLCLAMFASMLPLNTSISKATTKPSNPRISNDVTTWDCIYFGNYYQSNSKIKEPIKWRVLSVDGDNAFVVADQVLDCKLYNENYEDVTWETCTLRKWLNGTFLNTAFNTTEQSAIKTTKVVNEDNIYYGTEGGNNTSDKIFLLSQNEVSNIKYGFRSDYYSESGTRQCKPSSYAIANNCNSSTSDNYIDYCWWWLRSPGRYSYGASFVYIGGGWDGGNSINVCYSNGGVRPALNINLSSSSWSSAGTVKATVSNANGISSKLGLQSATYKYGTKLVNVLTTAHSVEWSHNNFTLECKAYSSEQGIKYYLETGNTIIRSENGIFSDLNPSEFKENSDLYIVAKDSKGNACKTKILLKIVKDDNPLSGSKLSFGDKTSFTFGEDVPFVGGTTANFSVPSIPVSVVIEDGKIKVGYNIKKKNLYSYNSAEGVTTTSKQSKKSFKQQWNDIRNDIQKTGYINKDYKGYLEQCDLQGGLPGVEKSVDFNIAGYAEGTWSSDTRLDTISGEIVFTVSGNATARKQLMVWVVPISLKITASASGTLTGKISYDFVNAKHTGEIDFTGDVSLEPFAGIGVSDWLSVGVYGKGTAKLYATLLSTEKSTGFDKFTLQGQAGVKGYFAKKEALNFKLIDSKEYSVWERQKSGKTVSATNKTYASSGLDSVINNNITENDTEWIENKDSDTSVKKAFSNDTTNEIKTVVKDVYGASNPQMVNANGVKVYGYVDETGTRKTSDQTVAKYVVYDEATGTSTEENIIDDDGTADYMLKLVTDGNEIYAVYLNSDTEFGDEEPELNDYAKSFKIGVAHFDMKSKRFVQLGNYKTSDSYCYNPSLAINENGFSIAWCENSDNQIAALTDTNSIYSADCDEDGKVIGGINVIKKDAKAVTSMTIDTDGNVLYAEDKDNLLTTEEQKLYYYSSKINENNSIEKCPTEDFNITSFSYQELPNNSNNNKRIMCLCDGILSYFDENDNAIKYVDESAYVGNTKNYYVYGDSIYYIGYGKQQSAESATQEDSISQSGFTNICRLTYNGENYVASNVTEENGYITSFATDGESMLYILGTVEFGDESSNTIKESNKLKFINKVNREELSIQNVKYDYSEFASEDKATITSTIVNTGTRDIDGVKVIVEDLDHNTVKSEEITKKIVAGDTIDVETTLSDLEKIKKGFYVKVVGLKEDGESYDTFSNEESYLVDLDKTELTIEGDVRVEYGDNTYVDLQVINSSAKNTIATVTLCDDQENEVYTEDIDVSAKSTQEIKVSDLNITDGKNVYTAKVETKDKEFYDCDNETTIIVEKISEVSSEEVDSEKYEKIDEEMDLPEESPTYEPNATWAPLDPNDLTVKDIKLNLLGVKTTITSASPISFAGLLPDYFNVAYFKSMEVDYVCKWKDGADRSVLDCGKIAAVEKESQLDGTTDNGSNLTYGATSLKGTSLIDLDLENGLAGINVQPMDSSNGYSWPEGLISITIKGIRLIAKENCEYDAPIPTSSPTVVPSLAPTASPTTSPTASPTTSPTARPTASPITTSPVSPTESSMATTTSSPVPVGMAGEIRMNEATIWDRLLNAITFGLYDLPQNTVTINSKLENSVIKYMIVNDGLTNPLTESQLDALPDDKWIDYSGEILLKDEKNVVYAKIIDLTYGYVYYICSDGIQVISSELPIGTNKPMLAPMVTPIAKPTVTPVVTVKPTATTQTKPTTVIGFKAKASKGKLQLSWKRVSDATG